MWTHLCRAEGTVLSTREGEHCNWCDALGRDQGKALRQAGAPGNDPARMFERTATNVNSRAT